MRRGRHVPDLLILAAMMVASGCGYSLAGRGSFLPSYIRSIGIPALTNKTQVFGLEQTLTDSLRAEFIARGRYDVKPDETGVDAILRGEIDTVTITPAAFNDQQQATRYIVSFTSKIEFTDVKTTKVLWENPSLVFREEFEVASFGASTDAATFFGQEANALQRVATSFARSVVGSILEAF